MEMDSKYLFKILPNVNDMALADSYIIRTNQSLDDSLLITAGHYRDLRDCIIANLKTIYTSLEYKDADNLDPYLSIRGYAAYNICLHVFHIKEWLIIKQSGAFDTEIRKALEWGLYNLERAQSNLPAPKRLK